MPLLACGTLFRDSLQAHTDMSPAQIMTFATGHLTASAEKIHMGACPAAMFRPSPEYYDQLAGELALVARRYDLHYHRIREHGELWLYHPHVEPLIYQLYFLMPNGPTWHALRALLCGIPASAIDLNYHQRQGLNLPCDRPTEE